LFAVQDVVQELLKACDDETRKQIQKKSFDIFPKALLSKYIPTGAAYDWLLRESENRDSDVRPLIQAVHVAVLHDKEIEATPMLKFLQTYEKAKKERDWRGHPCM
jgi:hypothetical protein